MKIYKVTWGMHGTIFSSKWMQEWSAANKLRSEIQSAASLLQLEFELYPTLVEEEVL